MPRPNSERLAQEAILWAVGEQTAAELVRTACDALVDGLDSQALRELAGADDASDGDVEDLVARVASDFDFPFFTRDSPAARTAAARVLARQCVKGELPPREFARWMHTRLRHGHDDRRIEALVSLDDVYDVAESSGRPLGEVDRDVLAAASELLAEGVE